MLKYVLLAGIALTLSLAYVANSQSAEVEVKVSPGEKKDNQVGVIGVADNQNGTSTVIVYACGSYLEFTLKNEHLEVYNEAVDKVVTETIDQACK